MPLLETIDDAINPIVVKELRQSVQSRMVVGMLLLFLLLQVVVMGGYLLINSIGGRLDLSDYQAGREIFGILQGILLGTCMLFLPMYTGARLAAERSDTNVDLLFITTLKPRAIISGKIVAALVLAIMIFSACTPFMAFTYFLRGVDVPSIVFIISLDFLVVMSSVMISIFIAVLPVHRGVKSVFGLFAFIILLYVFIGTVIGSMEMLQFGIASMFERREALAACGFALLAILGFLGLLFTWSVAMVHPPSANRAWPSRLLVTLVWLGGGVAAAWAAREMHEDAFLAFWVFGTSVILCLCLAIAICEREHWAVRVARTIPRNWLLRGPAFLFYSGSAGGVLHVLVLAGLTALAACAWLDWDFSGFATPPTGRTWGTRFFHGVCSTMLMPFLYTYCYAMTAVLLRRLVFRQLPLLHNWLLMLILMGIGSLLPMATGLMLYYRTWRLDTHFYWLLTNPIGAMIAVEEPGFGYRLAFYVFSLSWAGVMTALAVPWFFSQLARFRPYTGRPAAPIPVPVLVPAGANTVASEGR